MCIALAVIWSRILNTYLAYIAAVLSPFILANVIYWLPASLEEGCIFPGGEFGVWAPLFIGAWTIVGIVPSVLATFIFRRILTRKNTPFNIYIK